MKHHTKPKFHYAYLIFALCFLTVFTTLGFGSSTKSTYLTAITAQRDEAIAAVADTYFDPYVTMNSPVKVAIQLGFLGLMLVLLAELRFRVGKALPRYSVAFLAIGSYACLVGSVPQLCAFAKSYFGKASVQPVSPRYALYAAILLVAGIYGLYLLLRYTAFPPQDAEEASAIIPETDSTQAQ